MSDGLRYEVAKELSDSLKYQLKCDVKLDAIQSVFPAITKYGKPALLPGIKTIDDSMNILVSGSKASDLNSRRAILQKAMPESDAINYVDLVKMNSTEKKEFLKGKKVIYVYHDDIDSSGHDSSGESKVFDSCKETIDKLLNLVRALTNARASIRVLITSDHGFLYSYQLLPHLLIPLLQSNPHTFLFRHLIKHCNLFIRFLLTANLNWFAVRIFYVFFDEFFRTESHSHCLIFKTFTYF